MFERVKSWFKAKREASDEVRSMAVALKRLQAKYDAAASPRHLENYWDGITDSSASAEMTPTVRSKIRKRARYELRNNSWARGIIDTRAHYTIGTSPRPQLSGVSRDDAAIIERRWSQWAADHHFGEMLRSLMVQIAGETGEELLLIGTATREDDTSELAITEVEADRLTTPQARVGDATSSSTYEDGISYDADGNPVSYDVLEYHPGDSYAGANADFTTYSADRVLHVYRRTRPGQRRGVPDLTPALPMFALARRFAVATVVAAETSADVAAFLASTSDKPAEGVAFDLIDIEMGMLATLPEGWGLQQIKQEHPATTHEMFIRMALNECARCLQMPLNVAMMNSSGYNYASGRLDHQAFFKAIGIDQSWLACRVLNPILRRWLYIETLEGRIPDVSPQVAWFWDGLKHVDPVKEASAQKTRLETGTTTLSREYASEGLDWEEEMRQRSREKLLAMELAAEERRVAEELGVPVPGTEPAPQPAQPIDENDDDDSEPEEDSDAA